MSHPELIDQLGYGDVKVTVTLTPHNDVGHPRLSTAYTDAMSTVRSLCRHLPTLLEPDVLQGVEEAPEQAPPYEDTRELVIPEEGTYGTFSLTITPGTPLTDDGWRKLEKFAYAAYLAVLGIIVQALVNESAEALWGEQAIDLMAVILGALATLDLSEGQVRTFSIAIEDRRSQPQPLNEPALSRLLRHLRRRN